MTMADGYWYIRIKYAVPREMQEVRGDKMGQQLVTERGLSEKNWEAAVVRKMPD